MVVVVVGEGQTMAALGSVEEEWSGGGVSVVGTPSTAANAGISVLDVDEGTTTTILAHTPHPSLTTAA